MHLDAAHLRAREREALRGEHVAHLAGADAERDRAERAVRRGVAVAARDRHAGLREPELGADHVHDALLPARRVEERMPCSRAVALELAQHLLGERVRERPQLRVGRDDVVDGREGALAGSAPRRPISRSIWKACGLVTSWIRCRPIRSWVWPFGSSRTVCASQTLSRRLRRIAGIGEPTWASGLSRGGARVALPVSVAHGAPLHRPRSGRRRAPSRPILALHGWGASAHDLLGLAPVLHGGAALVLCPQGPLALRDRRGHASASAGSRSRRRAAPTAADIAARGRRACARFLDERARSATRSTAARSC